LQWVVSVLDHKRVLSFSDGVAVEKDLARGRILTEYRLRDVRSFASEGKTLTLTFHNGKIATYVVEDPLHVVDICENIKPFMVEADTFGGFRSQESEGEHMAMWSPDYVAQMEEHQGDQKWVIISEYFSPKGTQHDDKSNRETLSPTRAKLDESKVVSNFVTQVSFLRLHLAKLIISIESSSCYQILNMCFRLDFWIIEEGKPRRKLCLYIITIEFTSLTNKTWKVNKHFMSSF
jgi:hypothetical protein